MALINSLLALFVALTLLCFSTHAAEPVSSDELQALLDLKSALDPLNLYLSSWTGAGLLCDGSFEGVACHENGRVANISLQGKGLTGKLSPAIGRLTQLTGLYLHYNSLTGEVPREVSELDLLSDLYLNVNNFSGAIPAEIGTMAGLQVLQLCYNQFTGSIPAQFGALPKLSVLALQSNRLTGAIPASLGNLGSLMRLDLSFNHLFGSIPSKLADAPSLKVLDLRNNTLSGNVPPGLRKLNEWFLYENNLGLCGVGYAALEACPTAGVADRDRPEPYGVNGAQIPQSANLHLPCNQTQCVAASRSRGSKASVVIGLILFTLASSAIGVFTMVLYRRRKVMKLGDSVAAVGSSRASVDWPKEVRRKNGSPLISLEYSQGWDPLADYRSLGKFPHKVMQDFRFNLEEVESATQYFSEANLLSRNSFSAVYKGFLRDGSIVAIKRINKSSCKSDDGEFLKGLNVLTLLRHDNVVRLRGFCCSRGRGECFLIFDYVPNGSLSKFLDLDEGDDRILEWSTRVSIIRGIAKGIEYLHASELAKPALVHQNISADKVLINNQFNPLLSSCGLHKLLTNDVVFSTLKASAAMGYLAPEYAATGRLTDKSDVYAFGVLILQIISGKRVVANLIQNGACPGQVTDFVDPNLRGRFFEHEAAKLAKIALICSHESPSERPSLTTIVEELGQSIS
uniref:Protein kinase domain-containing protein n=1 Tax=Kalanchoe fedtschenkoi TaxID=63787 RepID=A0A7N0V1E6_KALFE